MNALRDIFTVFGFTFRDGVRKKSFIISTAFMLAIIIAACFVFSMVGSDSGGNESGEAVIDIDSIEKNNTCYYIDDSGLIPGAVEVLKMAVTNTDFVPGSGAEIEKYKSEVESDDSVGIIEVTLKNDTPFITYYSTSFLNGMPTATMSAALKSTYVSGALIQAGVSEALVTLALSELPEESRIVGKMDITGYALGIVLVMLMFFAVYYYGYFVAVSVSTEKTSRVMETLVVSAKPAHILIGKCIAMGLLGLLQFSLILGVGALGYKLLVPGDMEIMGMPLALSAFTWQSGLLVLVYFILGYSLFAMINSVCGATVSRSEDLQSAMMPSVLISMISFFTAYSVMFMPDAGLKRIVTYIPFTSPFLMPFQLLNDTVPPTDILISVILLIIAIIIISWMSIRLYSASVLHYGQRLKLKDLFTLKS